MTMTIQPRGSRFARSRAMRMFLLPLACAALIACDDDEDDKADAGHAHDGGHDHDSGTDDSDSGRPDTSAKPDAKFSFFVSSDTQKTGNLGGLKGADARCDRLATAVGAGSKTWHAYLSAEKSEADGGKAVNARDRIGKGPWYNVDGKLLAEDLDELHALEGDADLFLDEKGKKVNGQWVGSPTPNEHDILTGTNADGTLLQGMTCDDWTSEDSTKTARVGHSDGLGPMQNSAAPYNSWNSVHENAGCNDTAPRGGAGKIYCFAVSD
jgi:hypothetical protein